MASKMQIIKKLEQLEKLLKNDAKTIIGVEAVKHYKASFANQGFTDKSLKKWEDVKRRDPKSVWYGFEAGAKQKTPNGHPKRADVKKKAYKARKDDPITNYSTNATQRNILVGKGKNLMNSIKWEPTAKGVQISANTPYAARMNNGGNMSVFGKKTVKLEPRQFMGESAVLKETIHKILKQKIDTIMK